MGQPVVHFEIGCKDKAATGAFYAGMFDWKIDDGPMGMIDTGSKEGIQGHVAALAKVESLGGKLVVPPVEIPTGTFAWFADPEGNTVGLWKPKS